MDKEKLSIKMEVFTKVKYLQALEIEKEDTFTPLNNYSFSTTANLAMINMKAKET